MDIFSLRNQIFSNLRDYVLADSGNSGSLNQCVTLLNDLVASESLFLITLAPAKAYVDLQDIAQEYAGYQSDEKLLENIEELIRNTALWARVQKPTS
jgi:hypothetical protein